jgi:predicted phage terminase large subunit-like protein
LTFDLSELGTVRKRLEEERLRRELAKLKSSYLYFGQQVFPVVDGGTYVHGRHIDVLVKHLQATVRRDEPEGHIQRLLINQPPSTAKSYWVSQVLTPWIWTWWPSCRVMNFSYQQTRATKDSELARNLIRSQWYQQRFGNVVQIDPDSDQKTFFRTLQGGYRMTSFPGGPATGDHPDVIVIDDPLSADMARSLKEREKLGKWYFETIPSRGIGRNAVHIVAHQRLEVDDLSGLILKAIKKEIEETGSTLWYHVLFPMRYDPELRMVDRGFGGEFRTEPGELLFPELMNETAVKVLERTLSQLGPWAVNAQLGQQPTRRDGSVFKMSKIKLIEAKDLPRSFDMIVRFWDLAGTEDAGCNTAGVLVGKKGDKFYILDVIAVQMSGDDVEELMGTTAAMDKLRWTEVEGGSPVATFFEREPGSSGLRVANIIVRKFRVYNIRARSPVADKVTRSGPAASILKDGLLYMLDAPWTAAMVDEMTTFPSTGLKDRVDGLSGAILEILEPSDDKDEVGTIAIAGGSGPKGKMRPWGPCPCNCRRPAFQQDYCCEECQRTHSQGLPIAHSSQCNQMYNDWYVKNN